MTLLIKYTTVFYTLKTLPGMLFFFGCFDKYYSGLYYNASWSPISKLSGPGKHYSGQRDTAVPTRTLTHGLAADD